MRAIRFHDGYLNSVLVTLINPSEVLVFVQKFRDSRVVVNIASFIESQCQCNILSKGLGIDKELFMTSRKFLHSLLEGTEYHKLQIAQAEFKKLGVLFKREMAFLNLFMVSQFDTTIQVLPTLPKLVFEFCTEYDKNNGTTERGKLCVKTSKFITVVPDIVEIVDYLCDTPYDLELVLQYVMRYAGVLRFLMDYRKIVHVFQEKSNPVVLNAIVDLYFCMHDELVWREQNGV